MTACAATGEEHPPSRYRTNARSANAAYVPSGSENPSRNEVILTCSALKRKDPCPAEGMISSGSKYLLILPASPSRFKACRSEHKRRILPAVQFCQAGNHISSHTFELCLRKQFPKLQNSSQAGTADRF